MPQSPQQLHVDAVLTNLSIKYRNEAMIWPQVLPVIKVGKRSDIYYKYNKEDSYKMADDTLGPKSLPNEEDWGVGTDNYSVKDHGLADWLPQEVIDNSDNPLQPEIDTNDFLNMLLDTRQEKRAVDLVFNADSYPAGNKTQLSTYQWGKAGDDPILNVQTAVEACFMRANTLVFGVDAWLVFRRLPEIVDAIKAMAGATLQGGMVSAQDVANFFEVDKVIVGRSRYITSKKGQTATFARLWGKHMAALYVEPSPGIKSITFGATFQEMLRQTQRDFDIKRGTKGAHYIKVVCNSDEKVIASDCGYFIQDAVA